MTPDFRRLLSGLLLFVCFWMPLTGQDSLAAFTPQFHVGAWYSPSWNTVNFAPQVNQATLMGFRFGGAFRYRSTPNLGITVELGYDRRGWSEQADSLITHYLREIDYLELGFFTNIAIGRGRFQPVIMLGPYASYPLSETETIPANWDPARQDYYQQPLPKRMQYGLHGGLGFSFNFGPAVLQLDARYRYGYNGIFAAGEYSLTFSQSQSITAQATIFFKL
ncbi:MAG: PorT family protein [Lewinella sp.]|nr:PorT family protein [Lewinella sp.]